MAVQSLYRNLRKNWGKKIKIVPCHNMIKTRLLNLIDLFKIYLNEVLKRWKAKCRGRGIPLTDQSCLYTLPFANDQVMYVEVIEST